MLELLLEYGRRRGIASEPGFAVKDVRWAIECDRAGCFLAVHELGDPEDRKNRGQVFPKCPDLSQPELVGGSEERCHFLADSAQVVAFWLRGDEDGRAIARVRGKHGFFLETLRQAAPGMPELAAAVRMLEQAPTLERIRQELVAKRAKISDRVTVRIEDRYPLESDAWHEWWRGFRKRLTPTQDSVQEMRCFATGELSGPVQTHLKIRGLVDVRGLPTGDVLIGFDKEAFRSYGLEQSTNCAVSEHGMTEYCAALNDLVRNQSRRIAGARVLYWFKDTVPPHDDPIPLLLDTPEQMERTALTRASDLLQSIHKGQRPDLASNRYYALAASGAAGRVMVRDWVEGSFESLVENVAAWFEDLSIVHRDGGRLSPDPKLMAVLGATVRDLDDLAPPFVTKMWRTAIARESIPAQAMAQALARLRVDLMQGNPPNHARMGLLKACLLRARQGGAPVEPYLNEDHPHVAYQCGRLMSVLADLQHEALGDVGAGVVQRYYAAASSTPALFLGRLARNAQFHIGKSKYSGLFQDRIAGIWSRIRDRVPVTLTLEEQTLFALGYYQQMAFDRAQRRERSAAKKEVQENQ